VNIDTAILVAGLLLFIVTFELLRRRTLREKYAVIWIVFGAVVLVFAKWPNLLVSISKSLGFEVGSNFLFALLIVFLIFVVMQLSSEVGKLEYENQKLAEEVALINFELKKKHI
jgi:hypothetical protein